MSTYCTDINGLLVELLFIVKVKRSDETKFPLPTVAEYVRCVSANKSFAMNLIGSCDFMNT